MFLQGGVKERGESDRLSIHIGHSLLKRWGKHTDFCWLCLGFSVKFKRFLSRYRGQTEPITKAVTLTLDRDLLVSPIW